MASDLSDDITRADSYHRSRMQVGSTMLLEAINGSLVITPRDLVWTERRHSGGFWLAGETPSISKLQGERVLARLIARDKRAEEQRTFRDPCPLCAVRGDIGCKHRRAA